MTWALVTCDGVTWEVAPDYIYPVGIGEAEQIATANGCELPTPALVDAIWRAADLRVEPLPRHHNGTAAEMSSPKVYADQSARIERQMSGCDYYTLLAGTHKDVVRTKSGKLGLYGWHRPTGTVIQPLFTGHGVWHKDYSQGLRLCRRVGALVADEVGSPAGEDDPPPEAA